MNPLLLFSLEKFNRLCLIINTLLYVRVSQLFFLCLRRSFRRAPAKVKAPKRAKQKVFSIPLVDRAPAKLSSTHFRCFGECLSYSDFAIKWDSAELSDLARFHLHYFDFLRRDDIDFTYQLQLIHDWIDKCDFSNKFAWDPFTASLRVVNWIAWCERRDYRCNRIDESLHSQLSFISENDERELLANHYFENLKALLIGALYFDTAESKEWKVKSIDNLMKQLDEQFLADGGHYERSPFYHVIMTENLLDIENALQARSSEFAHLNRLLSIKAERALEFLADIRFPDGSIPLFNDSVLNAASSPDQLFDYARKLGLQSAISVREVVDRPDTGIFAVRAGDDMLAFNVCSIGPPYQPGHTRNDMLSVEVMLRGRRLFTNSGVFTYAVTAERAWCRSTAAQNTAQVGDLEQSEIWSSFRLGRRASVLRAGVEEASGTETVLSGKIIGGFAGRFSRRACYEHSRSIVVGRSHLGLSSIDVIDKIRVLEERLKVCPVHVRYLVGPNFSVIRVGHTTFEVLFEGESRARVTFSSSGSDMVCEMQAAVFSCGFGEKSDATRIECTVSHRDDLQVTARIEAFSEAESAVPPILTTPVLTSAG